MLETIAPKVNLEPLGVARGSTVMVEMADGIAWILG